MEGVRTLGGRTAFVRSIDRPTLVLGSTQDRSIADPGALERCGVTLIRRRSGGGTVLLEPGTAVWLDTWIPRGDPLWEEDVARSRRWVGEWWKEALGGDVSVHHGPPVVNRWSDAICFAGLVAGEVTWRGRKVVGVAQWRGREGCLTHSLAYAEIDWSVLTELLGLGSPAATEVGSVAATLTEASSSAPGKLTERLLEGLPDGAPWEVRRTG
jgi:lipoate-protein ligase A